MAGENPALLGFGAYFGAADAAIENWNKKKEKTQLTTDYQYLRNLYSPLRKRLLSSYMPGGEFSQRLAGLNREKANAVRYGGEKMARTNAYRTGGIRSGAVDRGKRGSWLNLMSQGQTSADMEALSRLAAQNLAAHGAEIQSYRYPGFGSRLAGIGDAFVSFGKEYGKYQGSDQDWVER